MSFVAFVCSFFHFIFLTNEFYIYLTFGFPLRYDTVRKPTTAHAGSGNRQNVACASCSRTNCFFAIVDKDIGESACVVSREMFGYA